MQRSWRNWGDINYGDCCWIFNVNVGDLDGKRKKKNHIKPSRDQKIRENKIYAGIELWMCPFASAKGTRNYWKSQKVMVHEVARCEKHYLRKSASHKAHISLVSRTNSLPTCDLQSAEFLRQCFSSRTISRAVSLSFSNSWGISLAQFFAGRKKGPNQENGSVCDRSTPVVSCLPLQRIHTIASMSFCKRYLNNTDGQTHKDSLMGRQCEKPLIIAQPKPTAFCSESAELANLVPFRKKKTSETRNNTTNIAKLIK